MTRMLVQTSSQERSDVCEALHTANSFTIWQTKRHKMKNCGATLKTRTMVAWGLSSVAIKPCRPQSQKTIKQLPNPTMRRVPHPASRPQEDPVEDLCYLACHQRRPQVRVQTVVLQQQASITPPVQQQPQPVAQLQPQQMCNHQLPPSHSFQIGGQNSSVAPSSCGGQHLRELEGGRL